MISPRISFPTHVVVAEHASFRHAGSPRRVDQATAISGLLRLGSFQDYAILFLAATLKKVTPEKVSFIFTFRQFFLSPNHDSFDTRKRGQIIPLGKFVVFANYDFGF